MGKEEPVEKQYRYQQPYIEIMDSTLRDGEQTNGVYGAQNEAYKWG